MNVLKEKSNELQVVKDIKIPKSFFNKFGCGIPVVDDLLGGFVPGQTVTLAAEPGSGKTTLMMQIGESLESRGKKFAYISGEETIYQLSFTSTRLNTLNIRMANMTNIDDIMELIKKEKLDFLVLDSIPSIHPPVKMNKSQRDEYITTKIVSTAKETNCVILCILHMTKNGTYKGTTLLPHSVDTTIIMNKISPSVRGINVTKNRMGGCKNVELVMTPTGFGFNTQKDTEVVKSYMTSNHSYFTESDFKLINLDEDRVRKAILDLFDNGEIIKVGDEDPFYQLNIKNSASMTFSFIASNKTDDKKTTYTK